MMKKNCINYKNNDDDDDENFLETVGVGESTVVSSLPINNSSCDDNRNVLLALHRRKKIICDKDDNRKLKPFSHTILSPPINVATPPPSPSSPHRPHQQFHQFEDVCEFALRFGLAAYRYGSIGTNVERFVVALIQHLGYPHATCRLTQSELLLCVYDLSDEDDDHHQHPNNNNGNQDVAHTSTRYRRPQMWMVDAKQGNNMDKLSQVADLGTMILEQEKDRRLKIEAENTVGIIFDDDNDDDDEDTISDQKGLPTTIDDGDVESPLEMRHVSTRSIITSDGKLSLREATRRLKQIDKADDPFGLLPTFLSWVGVGFALPPVLGSSWYDVLLGTVLAGVNFWIAHGITNISQSCPRFSWLAEWSNLVLGFVPAFIASVAKVWWTNQVNVAIVVVAAIAVPLPGYIVSLGVIELIYNRITPGFGHLLQGIVTLLWLALGASVGIEIIREIQPAVPIEDAVPLVSGWWQFLMVPILTLCLTVAFQNSYRDVGWSVLCQGFSYIMAFVGSLLQRQFFGYFLSAVSFTLFANLWAIYYNRPSTIIFAPSFVLSVSGSIGFRGLLNLNVGEKGVGLEQFLDMLIVALVILVGIIAGSSLVQPRTTL
ncbi:putative threonine/serine exporter [Nitzschia inconspicua]|uniref:Threonine/serine exporter n=1 Tax=Nitzschia inconspicua TaxID=303405 RepID=A0A9K3M3N6_9STRA|nr:putative threonine/serine exporter [Nitzschia inconspicua]